MFRRTGGWLQPWALSQRTLLLNSSRGTTWWRVRRAWPACMHVCMYVCLESRDIHHVAKRITMITNLQPVWILSLLCHMHSQYSSTLYFRLVYSCHTRIHLIYITLYCIEYSVQQCWNMGSPLSTPQLAAELCFGGAVRHEGLRMYDILYLSRTLGIRLRVWGSNISPFPLVYCPQRVRAYRRWTPTGSQGTQYSNTDSRYSRVVSLAAHTLFFV